MVYIILSGKIKTKEFDGEVRVCTIQASTVVTADYLLGSSKTMDDIYWSDHYNNHPRLLRMDVQVKTQHISDLFGELCITKNQICAARILYSGENENNVNIQMGDMYNKKRKASRAAADLHEARPLRYVPFETTHKISQNCSMQC